MFTVFLHWRAVKETLRRKQQCHCWLSSRGFIPIRDKSKQLNQLVFYPPHSSELINLECRSSPILPLFTSKGFHFLQKKTQTPQAEDRSSSMLVYARLLPWLPHTGPPPATLEPHGLVLHYPQGQCTFLSSLYDLRCSLC